MFNTLFKKTLNELTVTHKTYFESALAIAVYDEAANYPAIKTVSEQIIQFLEKEQTAILKLIESNSDIRNELYGHERFGRLRDKVEYEKLTAKEIVEEMMGVLKQNTPALNQLMQIHAAFLYRLYPVLRSFKEDMKKLTQRENSRLSNDRFDNSKSNLMGIVNHPFFIRKLNKKCEFHLRGMEKFKPNDESETMKTFQQFAIPFASGPSGHAISQIYGLMNFIGQVDKEFYQQYALGYFSFLAAGGHHSFHEVMMAIEKIHPISYQVGNYQSCLPTLFTESSLMKRLSEEFPQYLSGKSEFCVRYG